MTGFLFSAAQPVYISRRYFIYYAKPVICLLMAKVLPIYSEEAIFSLGCERRLIYCLHLSSYYNDCVCTSLLDLNCLDLFPTMSLAFFMLLASLLQTSYPSPVSEKSLSTDVNINDSIFSSPTIPSQDDADPNVFSNKLC